MTQIKVDYAVLENARSQMQSISRTLEEKLDTLRAGLSKLQWEGQDRAAYQAHQAKWDQAVRDINNILNEIGAAVGVAKDNYLTTEMNNSRLW
jgi:early secretory antigenic target protein ESAT-6